MAFMLPAPPAHARSLTGVADDLLASLRGASEFGTARSAVLFVIDGLGSIQLRAHAGHARNLAGAMARKDVARSVFPSTTAAALTGLVTGAMPGQHGLVGYSLLDPIRGRIASQLTDWNAGAMDPATWQRCDTVFERHTAAGGAAFAVGPASYNGSGFSAATLRGAQYVGENDVRRRVQLALQLAAKHDGALVYCYLPEADKAGHRHGVDSQQWIAALEEIDAAFAAPVPDGVGAIVTADHGMIDVPKTRHVLLDDDQECWQHVAHLGGEPRMLHVYLAADCDAGDAAARWQDAVGPAADVITRGEAIEAGLFGEVAADVRERIGDVLVITRGLWAVYDNRRSADKRAQRMIGQHGSVSPEETMVPFIRLGAFAKR